MVLPAPYAPVHTSADGDSVYAMSVGTVQADMDMVGTLAADVMSEAILSAVKNAETAYGYISANDFFNRILISFLRLGKRRKSNDR